jgi:hypothetical protein
MGGYRVDAITPAELAPCEFLIASLDARQSTPSYAGWTPVARIQRPTDRQDFTVVYRRTAAAR